MNEWFLPVNGIPLPVLVFGWPAVIVSVVLALSGIASRRWPMVLTGALVGSPFLFYLFASPRVRWLAPVVLVLFLGSAWAVARSHRALALALAAPFMVLAVVIAWMVYLASRAPYIS